MKPGLPYVGPCGPILIATVRRRSRQSFARLCATALLPTALFWVTIILIILWAIEVAHG